MPRLADEYGIVMGTSHQEPMMRAQKEWDRRYRKSLGNWNYAREPDVLQAFWREGIRRNQAFESIDHPWSARGKRHPDGAGRAGGKQGAA